MAVTTDGLPVSCDTSPVNFPRLVDDHDLRLVARLVDDLDLS